MGGRGWRSNWPTGGLAAGGLARLARSRHHLPCSEVEIPSDTLLKGLVCTRERRLHDSERYVQDRVHPSHTPLAWSDRFCCHVLLAWLLSLAMTFAMACSCLQRHVLDPLRSERPTETQIKTEKMIKLKRESQGERERRERERKNIIFFWNSVLWHVLSQRECIGASVTVACGQVCSAQE